MDPSRDSLIARRRRFDSRVRDVRAALDDADKTSQRKIGFVETPAALRASPEVTSG
jgi:hypothetical protein